MADMRRPQLTGQQLYERAYGDPRWGELPDDVQRAWARAERRLHDDLSAVVLDKLRPDEEDCTERTEAARAAVRRSDAAALNVREKTGPEIETMELRAAVRALIQEVEMLRRELDALRCSGDLLQSEGSRLAEWVLEQVTLNPGSVPYEAHMAALGVGAGVAGWTEARRRSSV